MSAEIFLFSDAFGRTDATRGRSWLCKMLDHPLPFTRHKTSQKDDFNLRLKTRSSMFMYPTTMAGYRKGINPVDALYNTLQRTLYSYDKNNPYHIWITELFKNPIWNNELQTALTLDCNTIARRMEIYPKDKDLKRLYLRFTHYKEVFKLMEYWEEH